MRGRVEERPFRFSNRRVSNFFSRIGRAYDAWSRNSVSRGRGNETRGYDREKRENGRGNEHRFQGENIALFRNRANGYCGPFTGRQAAVSLYLIGWRGGKKRRGWAGGLSIGERWNIPRLCAISVIQGGEMLDRRFFSPSFHLVNSFFSSFPFLFRFLQERVG